MWHQSNGISHTVSYSEWQINTRQHSDANLHCVAGHSKPRNSVMYRVCILLYNFAKGLFAVSQQRYCVLTLWLYFICLLVCQFAFTFHLTFCEHVCLSVCLSTCLSLFVTVNYLFVDFFELVWAPA